MKKNILLILVFISIAVLISRFFYQYKTSLLSSKERAGVRILSIPEGAQVFIDGVEEGKTPYENQALTDQEYTFKIQADKSIWQGRVKLNGGTLTVISRELSNESSLHGGEILTLEEGKGVTLISTPQDSEVEIDGKVYGKTPIILQLSSGEHTFTFSYTNYLKRSIRAYVPENFNLVINTDLAVSEVDLTSLAVPVTTVSSKVVVKKTPTGFLRVRDKPSLAGLEIARLSPGDEVVLLEELSGWDKIKLPDGGEGYVSKTYMEKKDSET